MQHLDLSWIHGRKRERETGGDYTGDLGVTEGSERSRRRRMHENMLPSELA